MNYRKIFRNEIAIEIGKAIENNIVEFPLYTKCVYKNKFPKFALWCVRILEKETDELFGAMNLVLYNNKDDYMKAVKDEHWEELISMLGNHDFKPTNYIKWLEN